MAVAAGNIEQAGTYYANLFPPARTLLDSEPQNPQFLRLLQMSHNQAADLPSLAGHTDEWKHRIVQAIQLGERLHALDPANVVDGCMSCIAPGSSFW